MRPCVLVIVLFFTSVFCPAFATDARVSVALEKTRLAYQMQKWHEVTAAAGELLTASPEHLEGHFMLALAETRLGQHEAAIKRLTWLNYKVPDSAVYRHALAEALMAGGLREQAVTQAQYAVQLAPEAAVYKDFLAKISSPPENTSGTAIEPVVASISADAATSSAAVTEQPEASPASSRPGKYEQIIRDVAENCDKNGQNAIQIIFTVVVEKPEVMADASWPILQERLQSPAKDTYQETIRQFLLWNAGELDLDKYRKYIERVAVRNLDWEKDSSLQTISRYLAGYGIIPGKKVERADNANDSSSWYDTLSDKAREAFFDTRYDDAWALHISATSRISDELWHYQAARLALELWQLHNFRQEWLEVARDHLQKCSGSLSWGEQAGILLSEVNLIIDGSQTK
jgi:hypothetical protein